MIELEAIEFRSPIAEIEIFKQKIQVLLSPVWQRRFNALWNFVSIGGVRSGTFDQAPVSPQIGTQFFVTSPYFHMVFWDGTQWQFADGGNGFIADFPAAPTAGGWQLCDGSPTTYLVLGATLSEGTYTTKALTGHYRKSVTSGADVLAAAIAPAFTGTPAILTGSVAAPVFTGTPAVLTGSVAAPTFTGNAATLTGSVSAPTFSGNAVAAASTNATPHLVAVDVITGVSPVTTATGTNSAPTLTMNSYTPTGSNSVPVLTMNSYTPAGTNDAPALTMNAYTPAGTIAATAQPASYKALSFYRR